VRVLDTSKEPLPVLLEMLQELTRTDSSRAALSGFIARYSRLRPVDHYVTIAPDPATPGAFRLLYSLGREEFIDAMQRLPKNVGNPDLSQFPLVRGGFIQEATRIPAPKFITDFELAQDPVLARLAPAGLRVCAVIPLMEGDHVRQWTLGFSRAEPTFFQPRDLVQATLIANLLSLVNRGFDSMEEVRRLSRALRMEIEGVLRVQEALLPQTLPDIPGLAIATSYIPSDIAGGDFFGFYPLSSSGQWALVIADVSGHGAAAATVTALITGVMMGYAQLATSLGREDLLHPTAMASFANRALVEVDIDSCFCTIVFIVYDPATGRLTYSNSGHNPPRIWRNASQTIEELADAATLPLGIIEPHSPTEASITLAPGDVLLLYTDGITELFDLGKQDQFGPTRMDAAFQHACQHSPDPQHVITRVHQAMLAHRGESTRDDDQTMVVIKRL
jgi:phosphoserine phosphatase RsbU/P